MIVNKFYFLFILFSISSFSQIEEKEYYFEVLNESPEYLVTTEGGRLSNPKDLFTIRRFSVFDRKEYDKRQSQIEKAKKEGLYIGNWNQIPATLFFNVRSSSIESLDVSQVSNLVIRDYTWLRNYAWSESDSAKLFFLLKTNEKSYLKYKVNITVIEN